MYDYRVLDLANEWGQLCGKMLGDLGADVLKVEPPGGDPARRLGPFYHDSPHPEKSLFWFAYNTNKRSITLNLESADGRELFKVLAKSADFLVETFPPGHMLSLGLGYDELKKLNPRIIHVAITPFGQQGPYKDYLAGDLIIMAAGGLMSICGVEERPPTRIAVPQAYCHAGAQAAAAAMIAHFHRKQTGLGQFIDVSAHEAIANAHVSTQQSWDLLKVNEVRGTRTMRGPVLSRNVWPCKDGYIAWQWWVAPGWGRKNIPLLEWMAEEDMAEDLFEVPWEELSTASLAQSEVDRWEAIYGRFFLRHTVKEIYERAIEHRILLLPCYTPRDLLANEQLKAREYFRTLEHPYLDEPINYPGPYTRSTGNVTSLRRRPPLVGEHNNEIYCGELGLSKSETLVLKSAGAI